MIFAPPVISFTRILATGLALWLTASQGVWAQSGADNPDWKESEVPPPPAFDVGKLVTVDVSPNSSLVYGVDPATIRISNSDGLVRYVMVATSASGTRNVMYEAIRCATGEFKTYARFLPEGRWSVVANPQWRSLYGNMPSRHALRFARAGGCDNAAPPLTADEVVSRLKNPNFNNSQ